MYLAVQKDMFTPPKEDLTLLETLGQLANNLYNQATYESRQYFFASGRKPFKVLNYSKLYGASKRVRMDDYYTLRQHSKFSSRSMKHSKGLRCCLAYLG
jgi:hypothetical protein